MGSRSDWETMQHAAPKLEALGVPHEVRVVSAHRTPDVLFEYAATRAVARPARDHRRRRRRGAPAGHARRQDRGAGARRAGADARRSTAWIRCCRSCRCRPAFRWRPSPSATPARPMPALFAAAMLALDDADDRRTRSTHSARSRPTTSLDQLTTRGSDARRDHRRHPWRRAAGPHARAFRRAARPALPGDGHRGRCLRRPVRADGRAATTATRPRWPNSPRAIDVATFDFENVPAESAQWLSERVPVFPEPARAGRRPGPAGREDPVPRTRHPGAAVRRRSRRAPNSMPRSRRSARPAS